MNQFVLPLTILSVAVAVGVVTGVVGRRRERRRTAALADAADGLGFEFHPDGDPVLTDRLARFHLFSQGHSSRLWNVLRGRTRDLDVAVFDYRYTVGRGKNRRTYSTTVACFRADDLDLPAFVLRPEGFWSRLGVSLLGRQDINFGTHPAFSKAYLLRGPDEAAVREVFGEPVLAYFEGQPRVSVEAAGGTLLYYRHASRVEPADARAFLTDGFAVLGLFREPPPTS
ncbi:MAG TPA: hypothetical protein VFG68_19345 [Fimbriiglobus sp.]|nr:hypothetical protein [Fimbriiglobus sp.]